MHLGGCTDLAIMPLHIDMPEPAKAPVVTLVRPRTDLGALKR
jgi:hypothetical protein